MRDTRRDMRPIVFRAYVASGSIFSRWVVLGQRRLQARPDSLAVRIDRLLRHARRFAVRFGDAMSAGDMNGCRPLILVQHAKASLRAFFPPLAIDTRTGTWKVTQ